MFFLLRYWESILILGAGFQETITLILMLLIGTSLYLLNVYGSSESRVFLSIWWWDPLKVKQACAERPRDRLINHKLNNQIYLAAEFTHVIDLLGTQDLVWPLPPSHREIALGAQVTIVALWGFERRPAESAHKKTIGVWRSSLLNDTCDWRSNVINYFFIIPTSWANVENMRSSWSVYQLGPTPSGSDSSHFFWQVCVLYQRFWHSDMVWHCECDSHETVGRGRRSDSFDTSDGVRWTSGSS